MMEAAVTSEMQISTRLHGATSQKTVIVILAAVRTEISQQIPAMEYVYTRSKGLK
jgi:hypothetical protein